MSSGSFEMNGSEGANFDEGGWENLEANSNEETMTGSGTDETGEARAMGGAALEGSGVEVDA